MDKFVTRTPYPPNANRSRPSERRPEVAKHCSGYGAMPGRPHPVRLIKGDLFTCPTSTSLAHCISADARMGKGIAVEFRKRFGKVDEIKRQGQRPGGVAVLKQEGRFIYNMVTKERHFHKPTYSTLTSSLQATREHCISQRVRELAMPKIGCGLDGLDWQRVSKIIEEVFQDSPINITVYIL